MTTVATNFVVRLARRHWNHSVTSFVPMTPFAAARAGWRHTDVAPPTLPQEIAPGERGAGAAALR